MTTTLRRRLAALALAAALACCALAAPAAFADEPADADGGATADLTSTVVVATGYCGDSTTDYVEVYYGEDGTTIKVGKNVTWTIYSDGRCVIEGKGGMCKEQYRMGSPAQIYAYGVSIKSVDVMEGVTSIGPCLFWANETITNIDLAYTVTSASWGSFPKSSQCVITARNLALYKELKSGDTSYLKGYYCFQNNDPSSSAYKTTNPTVKFEFRDVTNSSEWYYDSVHAAAKAGYIEGYEDGTFGPKGKLTRAQAATILWRYYEPDAAAAYDDAAAKSCANATGMADVAPGQWYTAAANWAVSSGVISGRDQEDGSRLFDPDGLITREQLCAVVANASHKFKGSTVEGADRARLDAMPDAASVDAWAADSVAWGLNEGVISGRELCGLCFVNPLDSVTRAEMAAIIMNSVSNGLLR